jgi:hypothetical protein
MVRMYFRGIFGMMGSRIGSTPAIYMILVEHVKQ